MEARGGRWRLSLHIYDSGYILLRTNLEVSLETITGDHIK